MTLSVGRVVTLRAPTDRFRLHCATGRGRCRASSSPAERGGRIAVGDLSPISGTFWQETALSARRLIVLVALATAGCPPTGDTPPFIPTGEQDVAAPDAESDADLGRKPDSAVPNECLDRDNDGFVERSGCSEPAGDCAPDDPKRFPGAGELCNGIDDDCDADVDEDDPGGGEACDTGEAGVCRAGTSECHGGRIECRRSTAPRLELCNGIDDDCNDEIDEGNPEGGGDCPTDQPGNCAPGVETCVEGSLLCVSRENPVDEQCNALDDDCDGEIDEHFPEQEGDCSTGAPGVCSDGQYVCEQGHLRCVPGHEPQGELCNGLDDDCDGEIDELWRELLGQACQVGLGACVREGAYVCAVEEDRQVECNASAGEGSGERCNGIDDDCDGEVDEDFDLAGTCDVGVGACRRQGHRVCDSGDPDEMSTICAGPVGDPVDERCNAIDDDCDGEIDEPFSDLGAPCVDDSGLCDALGIWACDEGGEMHCLAEPVEPLPERCNDLDDDCDGEIDESHPTKGTACSVGEGVCLRQGEHICSPSFDDVICDVVAGLPSEELCDGQDNDCDGRIDNGARCPLVPTAVVTQAVIADRREPRCDDLNEDDVPDNALGRLAEAFNGPLAESVGSRRCAPMIRVPHLPAEGAGSISVELLWSSPPPAAGGPGPAIAALASVDAVGRARNVMSGVEWAEQTLSTPNAAGPIDVLSPLFCELSPGFDAWSRWSLSQARVRGPAPRGGDDVLHFDGVALTGLVDRATVLRDLQRAADACAALGAHAPAGCTIFESVSPADLDSGLVADIDADHDGEAESVSICVLLTTAPGLEAITPPLGGQLCEEDSDCLAGLSCRPVPVPVGDPADADAVLARRCGVPGSGAGEVGAPCRWSDDCQAALCVEATAGGAACTQLCEPGQCPDGFACRGVVVDVEGARSQAAGTARVCVRASGSGRACVAAECPGGEICGVWIDGDVQISGGALNAQGQCERLQEGAASLGEPCGDPFDCVHGNGCTEDLDGVLRCLQPCAGTALCPAGQVCLDREIVGGTGEQPPVVHGFCVPLGEIRGSGGLCGGELDCPRGETCRGHALAAAQVVERYCIAGHGFYKVGQPCRTHDDCASGRCADGLCAGICDGNDDCGSQLGCHADLAVVPTPANGDPDAEGAEIIVGGLCLAAEAECLRDIDCVAHPPCQPDRCVCLERVCHIGCRHPGACPERMVCHLDNRCRPFCRDDPDEPNDEREIAVPLDLGREQTSVVQTRRLCASSPVDWLALEPAGLPFTVRVSATAGDDTAALELELVDAVGAHLAIGRAGGIAGEQVLAVRDELATQLIDQIVYIRVRASGLTGVLDYQLSVNLTPIDCPDPHEEPRDHPWLWTSVLNQPGGGPAANPLTQDVDGWICPQDEDWYAVYVANDDQLQIDLEIFGNGGRDPDYESVGLELIGPDFPAKAEGILARIAPEDNGGTLLFTPRHKRCNLEVSTEEIIEKMCVFDNGFQTFEFCLDDSDCQGTTYYVRVFGAGPLDRSLYRLDLQLERRRALECVPEPWENNNHVDILTRFLWGLDPAVRTFDGGIPSFVPGADVVFEDIAICHRDDDIFTLVLGAGDRLDIHLEQLADPTPLQFTNYKWIGMDLIPIGNPLVSQDQIIRHELLADELRLYSVVLRWRPGTEFTPYRLTMRRETPEWTAEPRCGNPIDTALSVDHPDGSIEGSTVGLADDVRPIGCIGGQAPDAIHRIRAPGRGWLVATVVSADGFDPMVYVRSECDVAVAELGCKEDDLEADDPLARASVEVEVERGDVYVIVDSSTPDDAGEYRLDVSWRAQDP